MISKAVVQRIKDMFYRLSKENLSFDKMKVSSPLKWLETMGSLLKL